MESSRLITTDKHVTSYRTGWEMMLHVLIGSSSSPHLRAVAQQGTAVEQDRCIPDRVRLVLIICTLCCVENISVHHGRSWRSQASTGLSIKGQSSGHWRANIQACKTDEQAGASISVLGRSPACAVLPVIRGIYL
jgi:hypothetical protein